MQEIERKFKIKTLPDLTGVAQQKITQAYLSDKSINNSNPIIRRVRSINDNQFFYTEKCEACADGMIRKEEEYQISQRQFEKYLKKFQEGNLIIKTRYKYPIPSLYQIDGKLTMYGDQQLIAEIDIFEGDLEGLKIVEVEFPNKELALAFVPPEWFGAEVTTDKRYRNKNLSQMDLSKKAELL